MNSFNSYFMNNQKPSNGYRDKIPEGYKSGQMQQFTPEMMQLLSQLFGHVGPDSPLSRMASGDQSYFDEMERPALRQAGQLQGNLASRFSGQGMGGRHSSGFQNTSSQAMNEFAQGLQANRQNMMMQAIRDLMGSSQMLLGQRPYERFLTEEDQGGGNFFSSILPFLGAGVGGFFGGLPGAQFGATLGSAGSKAFMG